MATLDTSSESPTCGKMFAVGTNRFHLSVLLEREKKRGGKKLDSSYFLEEEEEEEEEERLLGSAICSCGGRPSFVLCLSTEKNRRRISFSSFSSWRPSGGPPPSAMIHSQSFFSPSTLWKKNIFHI